MKDLSNIPGIDNTDPNYVNGKIVELVTLVKEDINQDIIQFFQKLMDLAAIAANDNQDNEANGYQTIQALIALINSEAYTKTQSDDQFLDEANNLDDLDNVATARTNLDVYSTSETDSLISNNVKLGGGVTSAGAIDGTISQIGSFIASKTATGVYKITHSLNTQDLIILVTSSESGKVIVVDKSSTLNTSFTLLSNLNTDNAPTDATFSFIVLQ